MGIARACAVNPRRYSSSVIRAGSGRIEVQSSATCLVLEKRLGAIRIAHIVLRQIADAVDNTLQPDMFEVVAPRMFDQEQRQD